MNRCCVIVEKHKLLDSLIANEPRHLFPTRVEAVSSSSTIFGKLDNSVRGQMIDSDEMLGE